MVWSFVVREEQSEVESSSAWRKSSFSTHNGNCVEVSGVSGEMVRVRDSKNPGGGVLNFTTAEWDSFIGGVREGVLDRRRGNL